MLHHVSFGVTDIERAGAFYDAVLAPLGYVRVWSEVAPGRASKAIGYGLPGEGDKLALKHRPGTSVAPGPGFHLAFAAPTRDAVDQFYAAAIAGGGRDNGAPGLRPHYGPDYYAAFVIDPDGYCIEAVINTAR
jgi:catechol 2,3-dioxygenase-like lactoylglutathione lyase family enzyme